MFIVGKKYQRIHSDNIYECLYADETGGLLSNGKAKCWTPISFFFKAYKEYKEPVVHTRYVHWYINYFGQMCTSTQEKITDKVYNHPVIKVDEVTYVEESK